MYWACVRRGEARRGDEARRGEANSRPCNGRSETIAPRGRCRIWCKLLLLRLAGGCWAEAPVKIARMTLTIKLDRNWSSFQLANSAPPLSVTDSAIAPSARMAVPRRQPWCASPCLPGACSAASRTASTLLGLLRAGRLKALPRRATVAADNQHAQLPPLRQQCVSTRARVHSNAKRHALKPRLELPLAAASAHVV